MILCVTVSPSWVGFRRYILPISEAHQNRVTLAMTPKAASSAVTTLRPPITWHPLTSKTLLFVAVDGTGSSPVNSRWQVSQPSTAVNLTMLVDNGKRLCLLGRRALKDTLRGHGNRRHNAYLRAEHPSRGVRRTSIVTCVCYRLLCNERQASAICSKKLCL